MVNISILVGYVGADPTIKTFNNNGTVAKVANFNLATSSYYYDKNGQKVENTEWHRITASGKLAESIEKHMKKGALIFVQGMSHTRQYEKDGQKREVTEVRMDTFRFLSDKKPSASTAPEVATPEVAGPELDPAFGFEDLPA